MSFNGTHLKNKELVSIYRYLTRDITQAELSTALGRTRTNTYYYIGRAVHYWFKKGIIRFRKVKDPSELGGMDVKEKKSNGRI
jgi:hypothetical protein